MMSRKKKLRAFKSPWHLAHDEALITALKGYVDFDLLINYTRRWDDRIRKLPSNAKWVNRFEVGKYDFAILNIDQQCTEENLNKAVLVKHLKSIVSKDKNCKRIWINHGTPIYPEKFPDGVLKTNFVSKKLIEEINKIIGDDLVVVNSHQAKKEWGRGKVIIHGISGKEYRPKTKEPRVASFISFQGIGDKYYNRSYLIEVMQILMEKYSVKLQWINTPTCFNAKTHKDYKEFLAKTLIYFNPTFGSPMPRSRTEAMLSGCCVITTPHHDADTFIKNGENGFLVPHNHSRLCADVIYKLLCNYNLAVDIGKRGRETALKEFSPKKYSKNWINFLKEIIK
jgi:glycosyltransferase involved in cell wall biosynthesis